jgi:hypothetical protein
MFCLIFSRNAIYFLNAKDLSEVKDLVNDKHIFHVKTAKQKAVATQMDQTSNFITQHSYQFT